MEDLTIEFLPNPKWAVVVKVDDHIIAILLMSKVEQWDDRIGNLIAWLEGVGETYKRTKHLYDRSAAQSESD